MTEPPGIGQTNDREAFAAYAADITGELTVLARRFGLDVLAYLLEMAHLEAKSAAESAQLTRKRKNRVATG